MKILIVDDSSTVRIYLRTILEKENYQVFEAGSGEKAVSLCEKESFDLITLDIEMEGLNGYETCRKIRELEKNKNSSKLTSILFITSNDTMQGRIKGFEAGTTDFITKPFEREFLLETVQGIFKPKNIFAGISILVAEDSMVTRTIISKILSDQGSIVMEADNGKNALELIRKFPEKIDLVITDHFMPEMNGDELCLYTKNKLGLKHIPFIFITAASEYESFLNIFKVGGVDYIVKPFLKEEVVARLTVHIQNLLLLRSNERRLKELNEINKFKDSLMATCAHDLRTPLNGILGFSELLLMEDGLSEEHLESLGIINSSGQFLLSVINDLLDVANFEFDQEFKTEQIFLNKVVKQSVNSLKATASSKNIHLTLEMSELNPFCILGNYNIILRAINNLVSNAIKFTKKNGEVKVVLGKKNEDSYFVSIEDNGIGIPEDKLNSIFSKFSKASRAGTAGEKGTGLGLSITKDLVERHGGQVFAESEEEKGTKFTVLLPISKKE